MNVFLDEYNFLINTKDSSNQPKLKKLENKISLAAHDAYEFEEKLTIKQKIILEHLAEEIFLLEKEDRIRKYFSNNYDKEVLDLILKYFN